MRNCFILGLLVVVLSGCGGLTEAQKHLNAAVELTEQGRPEEAIAEYDEAIRLEPQLVLAYHNRGSTYRLLGEYQHAIEDYGKVIDLDPQLAAAYAYRALSYALLGMDAEAAADIVRAVELGVDRVALDQVMEWARSQR